MSKKSEKSGLFSSVQNLTKHLDRNSHSVREQEEELRKIQSGECEKRDLSNPLSSAMDSSSCAERIASISSEGSNSFLISPPPYCGSNLPSTNPHESLKPVKSDSGSSFQSTSSRPVGNYHIFPLKRLTYETRKQMGLRLDLELANVKNWKNLADEIGFENLEIQNFANSECKTQRVLTEAEIRFPEITVGDLCDILKEIDRQDVITDCEPLFVKDMTKQPRKFGAGLSNSGSYSFDTVSPSTWNSGQFNSLAASTQFTQTTNLPPPFPTHEGFPQQADSLISTQTSNRSIQIPNVSIPDQVQDDSISTTIPDSGRMAAQNDDKEGYPMSSVQPPTSLPPEYESAPQQMYDGFVMYDVADKQFILNEFLPRIEEQAGIKLFIPGRDSPAGDHMYIAQLETMMHSCPKLIVIQSDEFLKSPLSKWSLNIALALDPAARRRKIIPVIYKRVTEPSILAGINACDRTRVLEDSWFWDGIIRSLKQNN